MRTQIQSVWVMHSESVLTQNFLFSNSEGKWRCKSRCGRARRRPWLRARRRPWRISGGARAAAGGGHGGAPAAEIPSPAAEIPSRGRAPRQPLLHHGPTSSRRQLPVVGPPHRGNRVLPPLPRSGHGQGFASRREKNPYLRPPWRPTHFGFAVWVSCWSAFPPRRVGILGLGRVMRRLLETA